MSHIHLGLLFLFFVPVQSSFDCSCGSIESTRNAYFYGEEMRLTCMITNPKHLGGITSSQLFFTLKNKRLNSTVVSSSAIVLRKNVTQADAGMYVCKIHPHKEKRSKKRKDYMVARTIIDISGAPEAMESYDVNCALKQWEILNCDWNLNNNDIDMTVSLYRPDGALFGENCTDTKACSWNLSGVSPPQLGGEWKLIFFQQFSNIHAERHDSKQSEVVIHPDVIVEPKGVESFYVQNIRNNATCLRLKWTYDLSKAHYKKSFKISYRCLSENCSNMVHAKVVDKLETTICDLHPGSVYNISISAFVEGGMYASKAVSKQHDTVKVDVLREYGTIPVPVLTVEQILGIVGGVLVAVILLLFGCAWRYCKGKVKEFMKPYPIDAPEIPVKVFDDKVRSTPPGSAESSVPSSGDNEDTPFIKPSKQKLNPEINRTCKPGEEEEEESHKNTGIKHEMIQFNESHDSNNFRDANIKTAHLRYNDQNNSGHQNSGVESYSKVATQSHENQDELFENMFNRLMKDDDESRERDEVPKNVCSDNSGHLQESDGYDHNLNFRLSSSESDSDSSS